jgi:hypothetical protein
MRSNYLKATLKAAIFAVTVLLLTAGVSFAQTVDLTASQQTTILPDGNVVPMWGWTCGMGANASSNFGSQLSSITVTPSTTVYTPPVTVVIGAPQVAGGTQATASATLTATNTLASITITNPGTGYTAPPSVTINGTVVATAALAGAASCTALTYNTATGANNAQIGGAVWQPPLIVVPYVGAGTSLTINLTNTLPVETSIVILGQAGGGLGSVSAAGSGPLGTAGPQREAGPRTDGAHAGQTATTWTIVVPTGGFTPPTQGNRARSFVPEVGGVTAVGNLPLMGTYTWTNLNPGTYLIRTGTYPSIQGPMGLYGVLVVTKAPVTGTPGLAYPVPAGQSATGVTYDADVVALESEIDPRQNNMVAAIFPTGGGIGSPTATPGFSETQAWRRSATQGPVTSIAVSPGGSGYSATPVVTINGTGSNATAVATVVGGVITAITVTNAGDGYSTVPGATTVTITDTTGLGAMATASVTGGGCGGGAHTCYPPAVDYTPLYFAINGLAFSKDNRAASALSVPATATTGNVLIRYVNAGSHMHVPTVNGLNMLLVAEDGYVLPDVALAITGGKSLTANPPSGAACTTVSTTACGLRIQDEVFQPAGKVFDVIVSPTQSTTTAGTFASATYPTWDRSLALGTNSQRDGGMQAVLDVNDTGAATLIAANSVTVANPDTYAYAPGVTLKVTDPGKGVITNDVNVYGVQVLATTTAGALTLYPNGTFTYAPTGSGTDSFIYCANGSVTAGVCSSGVTATVTLNVSATANTNAGNRPIANNDIYASTTSSLLRVAAPGVLVNDADPHGYPLKASTALATAGLSSVTLSADGSFTAIPSTPCAIATGCAASFTYQAVNSQGISSNIATVNLTFVGGSGLKVTVQDAATKAPITDYKWIIEQDLTLHIDPACQVNIGSATTRPVGSNGQPCPALPTGSVAPPTPATQFHASYYPVIATGCTGPQSCGQGQTVYDAGTPCTGTLTPPACSLTAGQHVQAVCDGYGICTPVSQLPAGSNPYLPVSWPKDAHLTATNPDGTPSSYYISILSGDSTNAFNTANVKDPSIAGNCAGGTEPTGITISSSCGHVMGGSPVPAGICTGTVGTASYMCTYPAPVAPAVANVTVNLQQNPIKTATVTARVFEDDYPLNGEPDSGGGIDVLATNEPGLGDFQFEIWDTFGGIGDFTGQMTYDMFNVPLTNALNGTIDPSTRLDACPISKTAAGVGIGVIVVCPQFESDGKTLSPLTGQAVVRNLMQGKYSLIVHPGAAREAAGEEWLQTNSLDGGHFLDSFLKVGEPAYFQEFGPGGFHVFVGMANPKIINARLAAICNPSASNPPIAGTPFAAPCRNTIKGQVANLHQARSPDENLYSGAVFGQGNPSNYAPLAYTNCYAALGDSDGATIALAKCDSDGNFTIGPVPDGNYGIVIFDQWDDFIVDGSSRPVNISGGVTQTLTFPTFTWQAHLWSRAYMDTQGLGRPVLGPDGNLDPILSPGLIQVPTRVRQRNGKFVNTLLSDITGFSRFDETFPLFAFYTVESDTTRFRGTGVHAVNDAGGQVDGPTAGGGNGNTGPYQGILNSKESFGLPTALRFPGSHYCGVADCTDVTSMPTAGGPGGSTGRIDPGNVVVEGWQGGVGEFDMLDWGKTPYIAGENGGIRGHIVNATTRPFDDPRMLFQNLWEPLVPNVTVNLYQEGTAADGTTSLTLVDTTLTSSWDAWAQGFRADGVTPNMNCTGQDPADPFFSYTMAGTTNYLFPGTPLPNNSQYKCYDGYHNLNQLQPASYDGLYQFPSATCMTPGATFTLPNNPIAYHCATIVNPAFGQPGAAGTGAAPAILRPAKYVTEVVLPPNWELSKEEDLNLLIGDQYIAPAVAQFGGAGLGNIYITPDQASIDAANPSYTGPYTAANPYNQPFSNCTTPGVASTCTFTPNTTNNGKQSTDYGRTTFGSFGPGGNIQQSAPCVGLMRIVPDYLSISPESGEVAPFAGSLRPLCDRKEVTLEDTMQANADFFIYTKTPKATTFTGFISDDFSSEFDPAAPAFGEKFAIPNVPVSIKDFNGNEISRLYSDQWGTYNGLVYSTWEVDPPNPTGYAPNIMITCMNDPGPIPGPGGTMITDPYYNPAYSNFCYENPFMPGDATYLDTPVVPTSAFAEGYNPPDCNYPDATPAVSEVDGDTIGPWVSATGPRTITIHALGDQTVPNNAYSGPAATTSPYNLKTVKRHYGFGPAPSPNCIAGSSSPAACPGVTVGGIPLHGVTWTDTTITGTVQTNVPACNIQQQAQYQGSAAKCGELVITAANGKQSIDAITVTIGGKAPTHVAANASIQSAIDAAAPGDLIIVDPTCNTTTGPVGCTTAGATTNTASTHNELLLMWKPVRLQGVGAASTVINANSHPAGKLDPWRHRVNCLFGLALNGQPYSTPGNLVPLPGGGGFEPLNPYDSPGGETCPGTGWNYFTGGPNNPQVDRLPLEGLVGWDTTVNGNLAELLQEPSLMGAYEGAGITVLAKGVRYPAGVDIFGSGTDTAANANVAHESQMPVTTVVLTNSAADCGSGSGANLVPNPFPSNFLCNPSRIDGLTITNSSQGGGGIFVHAWGHSLEIANNRVYNNAGTVAGGIIVGQGESPDALLSGNGGIPIGFDQQPWTCLPGAVVNGVQIATPPNTYTDQQLPYCYNTNVNVHHNSVTSNAAYGDELFSATPAGGGGVVFCTGADYYDFSYNWVCGNLSTGDGGGFAHMGFSWNGDIEHNSFLFNQSFNPTLPTHGGGAVVLGAAPDGTPVNAAAGTECGSVTDIDCAPGLSDGTGPGLVINANLFQGNTAESGSGGGLRLQTVNGTDVQRFPSDATKWYAVAVRNNIFANNVAGWTGGGVALIDALRVNFINNTVVSNDTTATAGVLFDTLGAPGASVPPNGCNPQSNPNCTGNSVTTSNPQPAGLATEMHTANLLAAFAGVSPTVCPAGHPQCTTFSNPMLHNDVFWQNRAFHITVGGPTGGIVQLNPALSQIATGGCPSGAQYWDIGVYGDSTSTTSTASSHASGLTLSPDWSLLTDAADYAGKNNLGANPNVIHQFCNGSRVPPEIAPALCSANGTPGGTAANAPGCIQPGTVGLGMTGPGGVADSLTPPQPLFTLTPAATVDEGNNWINMFYGPLSLTNPTIIGSCPGGVCTAGYGAPLGNYAPNGVTGSPAIDYIPSTIAHPALDFFGNPRPEAGSAANFDVGAIEFQGAGGSLAVASVTGGPLAFGNVVVGTTPSPTQTLTLHNTGGVALTGITVGAFPAGFSRPTGPAGGTCGATLAANSTCTIVVAFTPTAAQAYGGTVSITASVAVTGSPVTLSGTGVAARRTASLTPATWTISQVRNCPGTTILQILACLLDPTQTFTLTNTGNVNLTGVGAGVLGVVAPNPASNDANYAIVPVVSTCGNATHTTLAPGATCAVVVQFKPLTAQAAGLKAATISVTDSVGTQTSNLNGTAQ